METVVRTIFICLAIMEITSACQCYSAPRTVREGFCSQDYSFKGTILGHRNTRSISKRAIGFDSYSYSFFDLSGGFVPITPEPALQTVSYDVKIEAVYKGLSKNMIGQKIILDSMSSGDYCGVPHLKTGTHLFQVDDYKWITSCDYIKLWSDLHSKERANLKFGGYSAACKGKREASQPYAQLRALFQ